MTADEEIKYCEGQINDSRICSVLKHTAIDDKHYLEQLRRLLKLRRDSLLWEVAARVRWENYGSINKLYTGKKNKPR